MTKQEAIGASQTANVKSVMTVRAAAKNGPGIKRKLYIGLMKFLMGLSITITCGLVLFMIGYVLYRGVPNISWKLVSTSPSYLDDNIGILPDILNTLYIVIATLVIVLPLGVGAAIYLTEYATNQKNSWHDRVCSRDTFRYSFYYIWSCRNAVFLSVFKLADISFSRCAYSCDHESSNYHAYNPGELKDSSAKLP